MLMDIQLPVMSGLEATREIRRLERLNSIGVFSSSASSSAPSETKEEDEPEGEDKLPSTVLFKSPVIIVALTASSLQSDRHEALAAGCNDFLTKPVNFVWLERKVMEWGCMQALIDFDGWRKWKDFSQQSTLESDAAKDASSKKLKLSGVVSGESVGNIGHGASNSAGSIEGTGAGTAKRKKDRKNRNSLNSLVSMGGGGMASARESREKIVELDRDSTPMQASVTAATPVAVGD